MLRLFFLRLHQYQSARAVRTSSLRNISLRHNRITATGAVALALMIRDYPDVVPATTSTPPSPSSGTIELASPPPTPTMSHPSLPAPLSPNATKPVLPPPRHSPISPQTTYTPYIPRSRRGVVPPSPNPLSSTGQPIPIITSSSQGGVTTRHLVPSGQDSQGSMPRHSQGPSAALLDKVRALDALPRLGALRTLDLRGNDLRVRLHSIGPFLMRLDSPAKLAFGLTDWHLLYCPSAQKEPYPQGAESE
jgi:protein phosphatase 1 regulatory subunit 37